MSTVLQTLDVLRAYYADREGNPYPLNDVQLTVYLDALHSCEPSKLEAAARRWMQQSRWFPKVSDLLETLHEGPTLADEALFAWAAVERAVRSVGAYRAVQFADAAIGETVRQVFGSWPRACGFDYDSPGWHERREMFLRLYPVILRRSPSSPVLAGMHGGAPALVGHIEGLSAPGDAGKLNAPLSREESATALASIAELHRAKMAEGT